MSPTSRLNSGSCNADAASAMTVCSNNPGVDGVLFGRAADISTREFGRTRKDFTGAPKIEVISPDVGHLELGVDCSRLGREAEVSLFDVTGTFRNLARMAPAAAPLGPSDSERPALATASGVAQIDESQQRVACL
jgi:hypothetical protein